jgi:small subunit ribosomal protein S6
MREYELMVILRADLAEDDLATQIETVQKWIESHSGKITSLDHWGRRRLAYPIERQRDGYYLLYKLSLPVQAPFELERNLRINENVLRYLIVREEE